MHPLLVLLLKESAITVAVIGGIFAFIDKIIESMQKKSERNQKKEEVSNTVNLEERKLDSNDRNELYKSMAAFQASLQAELGQLRSEVISVNGRISEQQKEILRLMGENYRIVNENLTLNERVRNLGDLILDLKMENEKFAGEAGLSKSRIAELEKQVEYFRRKAEEMGAVEDGVDAAAAHLPDPTIAPLPHVLNGTEADHELEIPLE